MDRPAASAVSDQEVWLTGESCSLDDNSRIAFSRIMPDETQESSIAFLKAARAYDRSLGIKIERVMTDNGSCYKARAFAKACRRRGIRHVRTRP
jgi:transposase InsO family protein